MPRCHREKSVSLDQESWARLFTDFAKVDLVGETWTAIQAQLSLSSRHPGATKWSLVTPSIDHLDARSRSDPPSDHIQRLGNSRETSAIPSVLLRGASTEVNHLATGPTISDTIDPLRPLSHDAPIFDTSPPTLPYPEHCPIRGSSSEVFSMASPQQYYQSSTQRPYDLRSDSANSKDLQSLIDIAQISVAILEHNRDSWTDSPSTFTEYKTVSVRATLTGATMEGSPQTYTHAIIKLFQSLHESEIHTKILKMLVAYTIWKNSKTLRLGQSGALKKMMAYGRAADKASENGNRVAMIVLIPDTR
jgi:hypothetical protein